MLGRLALLRKAGTAPRTVESSTIKAPCCVPYAMQANTGSRGELQQRPSVSLPPPLLWFRLSFPLRS